MSTEIILKLLQSPNREDVILGLEFIKDWEYKDLNKLNPIYKDGEGVHLDNKCKGDMFKDNYIFKNFHCHWNAAINFYPDTVETLKHLEYIAIH